MLLLICVDKSYNCWAAIFLPLAVFALERLSLEKVLNLSLAAASNVAWEGETFATAPEGAPVGAGVPAPLVPGG